MFQRPLQRRYEQLVSEHLSPAHQAASGLRALPGAASAFASTQAAWRFYHNPRVRLPSLMQPLVEAGRQALERDRGGYALVMHDWSLLHFGHHESKRDRVALAHSADWGYELQAAVLVGSGAGEPLAPVSLSVRAADGVHCSRGKKVRPPSSQLDEIEPVMQFVERQGWTTPAVHVSDAEADSIAHYRSWLREPGRLFLVRADDRNVVHEGEKRKFSQILSLLWQRQAFRRVREVTCGKGKAWQWVAETTITITRPARPHRRGEPRRSLPGPPVTLRLVISQIRFEPDAQQPTVWFMLTNLPPEIDAEQVSLWYYWRWRIESYFKLLKSAGQHLEQWQQESAAALTRRLLVASMAGVVVWQLARDDSAEAASLRDLLIRLSGRQMKRGCRFTLPALLAGMWNLLAMLNILEHHSLESLRHLAQQILNPPRAGPEC